MSILSLEKDTFKDTKQEYILKNPNCNNALNLNAHTFFAIHNFLIFDLKSLINVGKCKIPRIPRIQGNSGRGGERGSRKLTTQIQ